MVTFDGGTGRGDEEYLQWCHDNPTGFVLNAVREMGGGPEGKLHKACCSDITTQKRPNYTTTTYIKKCSRNKEELITWAQQNAREHEECKRCKRRKC
jgi:hypothetical protein